MVCLRLPSRVDFPNQGTSCYSVFKGKGFTLGLPRITTLYVLPRSVTSIVQVVITRLTRRSPKTTSAWRVLKSLPCDIFFGAHGNYFGLEAKYPLLKEGGANPFVDPSGYKKYIAQKGARFPHRIGKAKTRRQVKD